MPNFSSIRQSIKEKSAENCDWRRPGRTDGLTDGRTDRHHHTIIRSVWRRAYRNVNIPLPSDNGCMYLHPKQQSRLRLSNESAHSLIDTIGRALLTLLGGYFELPLQICTRDNKKYVIKRIPFICKNVYILFQRRWLQEKTTHVLHFNNLTYVIFWDNSNKLRPWLMMSKKCTK